MSTDPQASEWSVTNKTFVNLLNVSIGSWGRVKFSSLRSSIRATITLTNVGQVPLLKVDANVDPDDTGNYYDIVMVDGNGNMIGSNQKIAIGDLAPGATKTVTVWYSVIASTPNATPRETYVTTLKVIPTFYIDFYGYGVHTKDTITDTDITAPTVCPPPPVCPPTQKYIITNSCNPNLCFEVQGSTASSPLRLNCIHRGTSQQFTLSSDGVLTSVSSGQVVEPFMSALQNYNSLVQNYNSNGIYQKWMVYGDGTIRLRNNQNFGITVAFGRVPSNGEYLNIAVASCANASTRWTLVPI